MDLRPYVNSSLTSEPEVEELERIKDQLDKIVRPLDAIRSSVTEAVRLLKPLVERDEGRVA